MSQRVLKGSIDLMKLQHYRTTVPDQDNNPVEVIVLPIDANYIERNSFNKKSNGELVHQLNVAVNVWVNDQTDDRGSDGSIQQAVPYSIFKAIGPENAKQIKLPTLAGLKDFNKI